MSRMGINIALAGNPNCGKTTLFNELTGASQYTGNWPGVTVEKKAGTYKRDKSVTITDLPGVYALSPYSPEEVVTRDYLSSEEPDVVIDIVDATNLERNLYLATQIFDTGLPVVIALNMMDLVRKRGDRIDVARLSKELGCPVVEISALKAQGIDALVAEARSAAVAERSKKGSVDSDGVPLRYAPFLDGGEDDLESALANARYDYIAQVCASCVEKAPEAMSLTRRIDRVVANRIVGIPLFVAIMFLVYFISVSTVGTMATDWVNDVLFGEVVPPAVTDALVVAGCAPWLVSLVVDGVIAGVGAVLGFVPQLIVLFLLLGFLEGCGYMARVAFIMDRIFRRFGLSGKSFIPMLIASGCGVPAVMAAKTIENEKDRRMTIMTTTMIPCGAKLPIIALVFGALAGGFYEDTWWVAPLFYFLGLAAIIVSCIMLKKTRAFAGDAAPLIMELPNYHLPTVKNVLLSTWERVRSYIVKAGTIIFLSSLIIWFLLSFGVVDGAFGLLDVEEEGYISSSLMAGLGSVLAWVFAPLGFGDWEGAVATITGLVAKENVVATVGIITSLGEAGEGDASLWAAFAAMMGGSSVAIMAFCAFNLLCAPCFAAIGAIHSQMRSARWTWAAVGFMCGFAWCVALMIYQLGGLVTGEVAFNAWTVVALIVLALMLFQLLRPTPSHVGKANDEAQCALSAQGAKV